MANRVGWPAALPPPSPPPLHLPAQVPVKAQTPLGLVQEGTDGLPEYPVAQTTAVHVPSTAEVADPVQV